MSTKQVWLVTGASKGLGLTLVKKLLHEGQSVVATSRDVDALNKAIGQQENFLSLALDITNDAAVKISINKAVQRFGRIDVLVNNAGYGQLGTLEELSDAEARKNFDVNVFGTLSIIRHAMPILRQQASGYVINISSIVGFMGSFPGWGIYNASKFAVAGMTEALSEEIKSMGVKTTIVYPGYFRTAFLSKESIHTAQSPIGAYTEARALERAHQEDIPGNQLGNPELAAEAFLALAEMETPPLHFFMGSDAYAMAQQKIERVQKDLGTLEQLSKSTDFQDA